MKRSLSIESCSSFICGGYIVETKSFCTKRKRERARRLLGEFYLNKNLISGHGLLCYIRLHQIYPHNDSVATLMPRALRFRLYCSIEEGFIQKRRQRSSLLFGGHNLFNSLLHLTILHQNEFILFFKSSWCKIASAARTNSVPQITASTFAFSSVKILL